MRISRFILFATVSLFSLGMVHARMDVNQAAQLEEIQPKTEYIGPGTEGKGISLFDQIEEMIFPDSLMPALPRRRVIAKAQCFGAPTISVKTCNGFGTLTENLAAIRAAETLGIPFDQVKKLMSAGNSLDAAIRKLRPGRDYSTELRRAREQAREDISRLSS